MRQHFERQKYPQGTRGRGKRRASVISNDLIVSGTQIQTNSFIPKTKLDSQFNDTNNVAGEFDTPVRYEDPPVEYASMPQEKVGSSRQPGKDRIPLPPPPSASNVNKPSSPDTNSNKSLGKNIRMSSKTEGTIAKYIARFRHGSPRNPKTDQHLNPNDFWWKSQQQKKDKPLTLDSGFSSNQDSDHQTLSNEYASNSDQIMELEFASSQLGSQFDTQSPFQDDKSNTSWNFDFHKIGISNAYADVDDDYLRKRADEVLARYAHDQVQTSPDFQSSARSHLEVLQLNHWSDEDDDLSGSGPSRSEISSHAFVTGESSESDSSGDMCMYNDDEVLIDPVSLSGNLNSGALNDVDQNSLKQKTSDNILIEDFDSRDSATTQSKTSNDGDLAEFETSGNEHRVRIRVSITQNSSCGSSLNTTDQEAAKGEVTPMDDNDHAKMDDNDQVTVDSEQVKVDDSEQVTVGGEEVEVDDSEQVAIDGEQVAVDGEQVKVDDSDQVTVGGEEVKVDDSEQVAVDGKQVDDSNQVAIDGEQVAVDGEQVKVDDSAIGKMDDSDQVTMDDNAQREMHANSDQVDGTDDVEDLRVHEFLDSHSNESIEDTAEVTANSAEEEMKSLEAASDRDRDSTASNPVRILNLWAPSDIQQSTEYHQHSSCVDYDTPPNFVAQTAAASIKSERLLCQQVTGTNNEESSVKDESTAGAIGDYSSISANDAQHDSLTTMTPEIAGEHGAKTGSHKISSLSPIKDSASEAADERVTFDESATETELFDRAAIESCSVTQVETHDVTNVATIQIAGSDHLRSVENEAEQQVNNEAEQQVNNEAEQQVNNEAEQQVNNEAEQQVNNEAELYTTKQSTLKTLKSSVEHHDSARRSIRCEDNAGKRNTSSPQQTQANDLLPTPADNNYETSVANMQRSNDNNVTSEIQSCCSDDSSTTVDNSTKREQPGATEITRKHNEISKGAELSSIHPQNKVLREIQNSKTETPKATAQTSGPQSPSPSENESPEFSPASLSMSGGVEKNSHSNQPTRMPSFDSWLSIPADSLNLEDWLMQDSIYRVLSERIAQLEREINLIK